MTKDEWAALEKKLQFRAFTMAKLGTATEIETAKQILADAVEKGETYAESWQTLKESLGGNPSFKPGYWETVFRTNTQSAYMAGKLEKYADTGAVAYQLLVIEDERTSKICRHLLVESGYGAILPVGHRFWQKYGFPPYHFNCRTSVCPIYSSQVAKTGYIVEDIPMNRFSKFKPQDGFGGNPLDRGSFWDMTDSMKKQAVKFGLMDLFLSEREKIVRKMANGQRRSIFQTITDDEKEQIISEATLLNIPKDRIEIKEGTTTHYSDFYDKIFIGPDVFPSDDNSVHNRDNLSLRAVLAHEYYGHRRFRNTTVKPGSWNDEFRASYFAALEAPKLTQKDRQMLMRDAIDRATEAGVKIKITETIRRLLYGF